MPIRSLTFDHDSDPLFTIAIDQLGQTYRVLFATGGNLAQYRLEPHLANGSRTTYRGAYINADSPLLAAIAEAERVRRNRRDLLPRPDCPRLEPEAI